MRSTGPWGARPVVPVDWTEGADHIIRFEAMQEGLDAALREVGVTEPHRLPHRNPTHSRRDRDYRALYTPRAREIVSSVYARELRVHGYDFEAGAGEGREGSDILLV